MKVVGQRKNHDTVVVLTNEEYNMLDTMNTDKAMQFTPEEWAAAGFRPEHYTPLLAAIWFLHNEVINRDEFIRRLLR